uniref:Uncharacterized protein n=1 Tax=Rhizophora mucronata TaxID=61149 RepID=A0A2P2QAP6_RHIMU
MINIFYPFCLCKTITFIL